jgi:hypothetical protein
MAQEPAQETLRTAAKSAASEAGVSTVQGESLKGLMDEPIESMQKQAKDLYGKIDESAGTDLKALREKLDTVQNKIDLSTNAKELASHLKDQAEIQQTIKGAEDKVRAAGVDPTLLDQADHLYTKARAMDDLNRKIMSNPSIVRGNVKYGAPENVNINTIIKAAENMQRDLRYGAPRLEQALGKGGADKFLKGLYDAKAAGDMYVRPHQVAVFALRCAAASAAIGGGVRLLHSWWYR